MGASFLSREYVWGPGDGRGGVDELLVQFDREREPWWILQDDGGDIVALCDLGGPPVNSIPTARVRMQWTYDAYGDCLSATVPTATPFTADVPTMHAGHGPRTLISFTISAVCFTSATAPSSEYPRPLA